jgi:hypothetical protein
VYREIPFDETAEASEYARVTSELARFHPYVVVMAAKGPLVPAIENAIPTEFFRPIYVVHDSLEPELLALLSRSPEWRFRLYGTMPISTTPANARLVLHYNETFPEPITRALSPSSAYDAFYVVAYATHALGSSSASGAKLASVLPRLRGPARTVVDVGAAHVVSALGALRRGENIELIGTTGALALDPETGTPHVDLAVMCPGVDEGAMSIRESGLIFRSGTSQLEGELTRCR